ncbi:MAG: NAD(P)-dependent alcohol dehydrogenase [Pseudomonadota bacterium]
MKINAAVTPAIGARMTIAEMTLEAPRDNEVLVRVIAAGICSTDVHMRDHPSLAAKPIVLGHEGAGIVEQVGARVTRVKPGDHVVMHYNSCGHCAPCVEADTAYCQHVGAYNFSGTRPDGSMALSHGGQPVHSHFFGQSSFATHALCTDRNLVAVPDDVPLDMLGPLGCGILTGAGAVINTLKVRPGSSFAVFGAGSVGLAAVMAARLSGAGKIIAVDTQQARLDMALELGATHVIDPRNTDMPAEMRRITGAGVNHALDTSGNITVIRQAVEALASRGVCGLISSANGADISLNVLNMMHGGRVVRGILLGDSVPEIFIPQLIELQRQGRFPFEKLITYYPFEQINQAVEDMEQGRVIKPVLRMTAGV